MPKYQEPPPEYSIKEILDKINEEFWKTHTLIKSEYYICLSSYEDYDPEYGRSTIISEKKLYGPYEDAEEALQDIRKINDNPKTKPSRGHLFVQKYDLVEKVETKRYWIIGGGTYA